MSAFGGTSPSPDFGITRVRKTHVKFDTPGYEMVQPSWSIERTAVEIGRGVAENRAGLKVGLVDDLGWVIKNYWEDEATHSERTEDTTSLLTTANAQVASVLARQYEWITPNTSYMSNILSGAGAGIATGGAASKFRKKVAAGSSWAVGISDSYPTLKAKGYSGMTADEVTIALDTVIVSNDPDNKYQDIFFSFWTPGSTSSNPQLIYQLVFVAQATGPIGTMQAGKGQYLVNFYGNGYADVLELGVDNSTWMYRMSFRYDVTPTVAKQQSIKIYKAAYDPRKNGIAGKIIFHSKSGVGESVENFGTSQSYTKVSALVNANHHPSYSICPSAEGLAQQTWETSIRIKMRRDLRGSIDLRIGKKPTTATLVDDDITIPIQIYDQATLGTFDIAWKATLPNTSCTIVCKVYDPSTGSELPLVSSSSTGRTYRFVKDANGVILNTYRVKIFFTGDGAYTPYFHGYRIGGDAIFLLITDPTETEFRTLRGINIMGAERDPRHNIAHIMLSNLGNDATVLRTRGSIPIKVEVEDSPDTDPTKRTVLFRGYTKTVNASRKTRLTNSKTVGSTYYDYNIDAIGMFQRLSEQISIQSSPLFNLTNGQPFKVTDMISSWLSACGFPTAAEAGSSAAAMQDIPDSLISFFNNSGGFHEQLDIFSEIGHTILSFLDQYLGWTLYFDENAGTYGKWKLLQPATVPYQNKCQFVTAPYSTGGKVVATARLSYPSANLPAGFEPAATALPQAFIRKNSFKSWVKPPEGNVIIASSAMKTTPNGVPQWRFQVLPNFVSADFGNGLVDSSHPDYLGRVVPIYVMCPNLATIPDVYNSLGQSEWAALNWIARRAYDVSCHAIKFCSFEAPLLLITHEDDATRKRPLRYYDPVVVDGEQFLIRNVNPTYRKDHIQMAIYECEGPRI